MDRIRFDAIDVLRRAKTEYPGVQSAGALIDQLAVVVADINLLLLDGTGIELHVNRDPADAAGLKFEILLV